MVHIAPVEVWSQSRVKRASTALIQAKRSNAQSQVLTVPVDPLNLSYAPLVLNVSTLEYSKLVTVVTFVKKAQPVRSHVQSVSDFTNDNS